MFFTVDESNSMSLDRVKFKKIVDIVQATPEFAHLIDMPADKLYDMLDTNKDGTISWEEYAALMNKLGKIEAPKDTSGGKSESGFIEQKGKNYFTAGQLNKNKLTDDLTAFCATQDIESIIEKLSNVSAVGSAASSIDIGFVCSALLDIGGFALDFIAPGAGGAIALVGEIILGLLLDEAIKNPEQQFKKLIADEKHDTLRYKLIIHIVDSMKPFQDYLTYYNQEIAGKKELTHQLSIQMGVAAPLLSEVRREILTGKFSSEASIELLEYFCYLSSMFYTFQFLKLGTYDRQKKYHQQGIKSPILVNMRTNLNANLKETVGLVCQIWTPQPKFIGMASRYKKELFPSITYFRPYCYTLKGGPGVYDFKAGPAKDKNLQIELLEKGTTAQSLKKKKQYIINDEDSVVDADNLHWRILPVVKTLPPPSEAISFIFISEKGKYYGEPAGPRSFVSNVLVTKVCTTTDEIEIVSVQTNDGKDAILPPTKLIEGKTQAAPSVRPTRPNRNPPMLTRLKSGSREPEKPKGPKYIISIDFGTTRTGFAYCIVEDSSKAAVKFEIQSKYASSDVEEDILPNEKSDTILVALNSNPEKTFKIGLQSFINSSDTGKTGWMATDFKMKMDMIDRRRQNPNDIHLRKTMVPLIPLSEETQPAEMELIDVVCNYLRIVGDISYEEICSWANQKSQPHPTKDDISWVITVPAIWTDQARIFMREAAFKAGLVSDGTFSKNIGICLEPEGAALYCFGFAFRDLLAATRKRQNDLKLEVTGLKNETFLVIDLGGGTTDITYHKITAFDETYETCDFEELRPPSGGPWGGRLINQELDNKLMAPLLGSEFGTYNKLKDIKAKFLAREFKGKKAFDGTREIFINLNVLKMEAQIDIFNLCEQHKSSFDPELVKIANTKARSIVTLTPAFVKQLFAIVLDPLKNHLSEIIPALSETPNFAILVGGMGANKYVKSELESFLDKLVPGCPIKLIQPSDAGLAIVQGAVRFAYNPTVFGVRKARTNYGLATCKAEEPNKLLFTRIIAKGTPLNETRMLGPYLPANDKQTVVVISIYEADTDTVKYVDDPECILVAQINVDVNMSLPFKSRGFNIELMLEGTVISGVVRPKEGGEVTVLRWTSC